MVFPPLQLPALAQHMIAHVFWRLLGVFDTRIRLSDKGAGAGLSPASRVQHIAMHARLVRMVGQFNRVVALAVAGRLRSQRPPPEPDPAEAALSEAAAAELAATRAAAAKAASEQRAAARAERARKLELAMRGKAPPRCPFGEHWITPTNPNPMPAYPTHGFGWMLKFVGRDDVNYFTYRLQIGDAELRALCHASPQATRVIRSLCWALAVAPPAGMFPKRRRTSRARPKSERKRREWRNPDGRDLSPHMMRKMMIVCPPQARDRWWAEKRRADAAAADSGIAGPAGVRRGKR